MGDNLCSYVCFDHDSNQWMDVYVHYEHTGSYQHVVNILTYHNQTRQYDLPIMLFIGDRPKYVLYKRMDNKGKLQRMQWLANLESFSTHFSINETNEVILMDDCGVLETTTPPALRLNFPPTGLSTESKTGVVSKIPDSRDVDSDSASETDFTPEYFEEEETEYRPIECLYEGQSTKASSLAAVTSPNSILKGSRNSSPRLQQLRVHFSENSDSRNTVVTNHSVIKRGEEPPPISLSQWSMACESTLGKWGILIVFIGLVGLLFASYATPLFYTSTAMAVAGATMFGISFFSTSSGASNAPTMNPVDTLLYP